MNDSDQNLYGRTAEPGGHDDRSRTPGRADTGKVPELARHSDPSQATKTAARAAAADAPASRRGVVWLRPSELAAQATAKAAGRGIDFHAELARRARRPVVQTVAASRRAISERARRLPPVTAFGRRGRSAFGASRSGIGWG